MPGLIDSDTGLAFGGSLIWLDGGLGGPGLDDPDSDVMETEGGVDMVTEGGEFMVTEA